MPTSEENTLDTINFALTYFFIFEMVFKWVGIGFVQYFSNRWNNFDAVVVVLSIVTTVPAFFTASFFSFFVLWKMQV